MKPKILLIEDEYFISDLYKHILEDGGFEVSSAIDGPTGLELAKQMPNLILLDIMLPKMNGVEVLTKLKNDPQTLGIPVVLVTNLGQAGIIKESFNVGAQGYLLKMSLTPEQLVNTAKMFISNPQMKMDLKSLHLD